jgi:hypothetical protein
MGEQDKGMNGIKEREKMGRMNMWKVRFPVKFQRAFSAIILNPQQMKEQELQECER